MAWRNVRLTNLRFSLCMDGVFRRLIALVGALSGPKAENVEYRMRNVDDRMLPHAVHSAPYILRSKDYMRLFTAIDLPPFVRENLKALLDQFPPATMLR